MQKKKSDIREGQQMISLSINRNILKWVIDCKAASSSIFLAPSPPFANTNTPLLPFPGPSSLSLPLSLFTPKSKLHTFIIHVLIFITIHLHFLHTHTHCIYVHLCVYKHFHFFLLARVWFNSLPIGMEGNDISISMVASEMVVGDRELLDKKIAAIRSTGHQKLQVLLAFIMWNS